MVAVDGSKNSERAFQEALTLAKDSGGKVRIVHVVDLAGFLDPEYIGPSTEVWDALLKEGRDLLCKAQDVATTAGVMAEASLLENRSPGSRIAQLLVEEADAWMADLIVAGTHGRRGASRLLLGSVAEHVARLSNTPLLLVRDR
jgi:nucleotide-binding universal stress UspA family protein